MSETIDPYSYTPSEYSNDKSTVGIATNKPPMEQIQDLFDSWDGKQSSTSTPKDVKVDPYAAADNYAMQHTRSQPRNLWETTSYNPESKERYKDVKSLYNEHFDPSADNERVAYENWDKWDAISTGFGRFKDSFLNSFVSSAETWPKTAKALFFGSTDYLFDSQNELDKQAYEQHLSDIENPVFYAPGTEDDIFTKGFLAETIGNLGFTLGTLAEVGAEFLVGKALEAVSFGTAAPIVETQMASKLPLLARVGTVWKNMFTVFKTASTGEKIASLGVKGLQVDRAAVQAGSNLFKLAPTVERFNSARKLVAEYNTALKSSVDIWDNALKVASKIPFAGEMADATRLIRAGRKAELTTGQLMKIGAGGLRRSFAEWQMASGEASVEMGGVYADLVEQLKDDYRKRHNGEDPAGDELLSIRDYAMKAASADFGYNVAILGITNKIQFGNLLGKFGHDNKAIFALRRAISEDASKLGILGVEGIEKGTGKALTKLYNTNKTLGFFGVLPEIYSDFGAPKAAWELGKNTLKGLTKIQVSEGLQENMQEVAAISTKKYYGDLYSTGVANWSQSFNDAVNSQMTKQGYKTFLSGALTGLFLSPGYHAFGRIASSVNKESRAHEDALNKSLEYLNKFFKSDNPKILKETIKQIKLQGSYNDGMVEGMLEKDKYKYYNNQDSALIQTVMHAKRTGTMDYLVSFLDGYGNNFTEEQFKDAFNYTGKELGKSSHQEVMSDIASSVERFSDLYDKYQTKWQLYLTLDEYIEDPYSKQKFSIKQAALQDAITTAAFLEAKSEQSIIRGKDILGKVIKYKSIGDVLSANFMTLASPEKLQDNIAILNNEIKSIQEAEKGKALIDPSTKKSLESKKEELLVLAQIQYFLYERENVPDPTDPSKTINVTTMSNIFSTNGAQKELAPLFKKYFELKSAQQNKYGVGQTSDLTEIESAMHDIYDYFSLGQDHAEYIDSVNLLNDPDKFGNYVVNFQNARIGAMARSLHDSMVQLAGLSEIAKKHVEENSDLMDELLVFATSPLATFDNYKKLQEINDQITDLNFKSKLEASDQSIQQRAQAAAKANEGKTPEEIEKERRKNSTIPLPILDMEEEIRIQKEAGKDTSELEKQIFDYMNMRYNLKEIETTFPFESTEKKERVVNRYYLDENGNSVLLSRHIVPVEFSFDTKTTEPVNNYEQVIRYLKVLEQFYYNKYTKEQANNTQVSDDKAKDVDNEKSRLKNFVGSAVTLSGKKGKLEFKNNEYVFVPNDGTAQLKIADELVNGTEPSFDDFTNLSIDYDNGTEESKEVFNTTPESVVDTQDSGTLTIELDQTTDNVYINGVKYQIIKDENGLAVEFRRDYYKKKGKGQKLLHDRISGKKPKGADYCRRVNAFLLKMRPIPADNQELQDEIDAYTSAIEEIKNELRDLSPTESGFRLMRKYQLNKIKNENIPEDILEIKTKFDNGFTRNQISHNDLLKLFMWADDLVKLIKKEFRKDLTDPFIWSQIQELEKEYVNPISSKLNNGSFKPRNEGVEKKPSTKKIGVPQSIESITSGESKSDTTETGKDTGKQQSKKSRRKEPGGLKAAVEKVENKADSTKQLSLDFEESSPTADPIQEISVEEGIEIINSISSGDIIQLAIGISDGKSIKSSDSTEVISTPSKEVDMLKSLSDLISSGIIARPEGPIKKGKKYLLVSFRGSDSLATDYKIVTATGNQKEESTIALGSGVNKYLTDSFINEEGYEITPGGTNKLIMEFPSIDINNKKEVLTFLLSQAKKGYLLRGSKAEKFGLGDLNEDETKSKLTFLNSDFTKDSTWVNFEYDNKSATNFLISKYERELNDLKGKSEKITKTDTSKEITKNPFEKLNKPYC